MGQNLHKILNPALAAQEEISLEAKGGTKSLFFSGPEVLISDQHWKIPLYNSLVVYDWGKTQRLQSSEVSPLLGKCINFLCLI